MPHFRSREGPYERDNGLLLTLSFSPYQTRTRSRVVADPKGDVPRHNVDIVVFRVTKTRSRYIPSFISYAEMFT